MLVLLKKPHFCAFTQATGHSTDLLNQTAITDTGRRPTKEPTQTTHHNEPSSIYEQITLPVLGIDILSAFGEIT